MESEYRQFFKRNEELREKLWKLSSVNGLTKIEVEKYETTLIQHIPKTITENNKIVEDSKYFTFNNKTKVRKIAWLKSILSNNQLPSLEEDIDCTTGELYIASSAKWMLRASDKEFVSWSSCFAKGGTHWRSCLEFATSPNIVMALILNSDKTRIIGRKWVILPWVKGDPGNAIFYLKSYGTFPLHYQRALSEFLIQNTFGEKKTMWNTWSPKDIDQIREAESAIAIEGAKNVGYGRFGIRSEDYKEIWIDDSAYVTKRKDFDVEGKISFLNDVEEEEPEPEYDYVCDYCGEGCDEVNEVLLGPPDSGSSWYCEDCCNIAATYCQYTNGGIYVNDDFLENYTRVDSYGRELGQALTYIGDDDLIEVNVIRKPREACEGNFVCTSIELFDGVPEFAMEYDGEWFITENKCLEDVRELLCPKEDEDEEA